MDTENRVVKARGGAGAGRRGLRGGRNWGTSVILSTVKKKFYWDLSCKTL